MSGAEWAIQMFDAALLNVSQINHYFQIGYVVAGLLLLLLTLYRMQYCNPHSRGKSLLQLSIYHVFYLFGWLALEQVWLLYSGQRSLWFAVSLLIFCLLMLYSRFIEPHRLKTHHTRIQLDAPQRLCRPLTVVLVADVHVGLFSGKPQQLKKITRAINAVQPDLVLFAGDWTYEPNQTDLTIQLAALAEINAPAYSVLGNHDEQVPGPPLQVALQAALKKMGIMDIEGQIIDLDEVRLIGTGDLWAGKADLSALSELPQDKPWLIMAHNPDTADLVPSLPHRPLLVAGHTHGGQVNLPYLTTWLLSKESRLGCVEGRYSQPTAELFVTAGTGLVWLPVRFRMPPRIDVLTLF